MTSKHLLKSTLVALTLLLLSVSSVFSQTLPYTFVNNSDYSDDQVYVAIVGITDGHVWVDAATGAVNPMNSSYNTVAGPVIDGNYGPGNTGLYADCFTPLSEIPNHVINVPKIAGCRIFISFGSQLYLYFFGYDGDVQGYAAPNLANSTDPNQGIKYELVELTYNEYGLWCNTTRVDNFQYPMGLEVYGTDFYKKVGEVLPYNEILSRWEANAPSEFQPLYDKTTGTIHFPSKSDEFPTDYFDAYIDAIWTKYRSAVLTFNSGDAGTWNGTVSGDVFTFTRQSDGQVAYVYSKPSQEEALEGSGAFATGGTFDLIVQAQLCAAVNRHALDLTLGSGVLQDFSNTAAYYQTAPYNYYCKFFHNTDITYENYTYTFCYDDVFDQSSTVHTPSPESAIVTIGGFYGIDDNDDNSDSETGVSGLAGTYYIQNRKSGLVMDVYYGSTDDGANILQYTNGGTDNQQFTLTEVSTGVYTMTNVNSGKLVDVAGNSSDDNANIHQWTSNGCECQQFKAISTGNGYYKFKAMHSGKIIEVVNGSTDANANVSQYTDNNQLCGQWSLEPVSGAASWSTTIEAEDFTSYSGVETETCDEGGEDVGYIDTGDWMSFAGVEIPYSGTYTISYRVASESTGGQLSLDHSSGATLLHYVDVPVTGGWQTWTTVSSTVTLDAGTYDFGIYAQSGGWNFNWFSITYSGVKSAKVSTPIETVEKEVYIFPNPTTNLLNISGVDENAIIEIYSVTGRQIKTGFGSQINVADLPAGSYIIRIKNNASIKSLHFIKK